MPQGKPPGGDTANQWVSYSGSGTSWTAETTDGFINGAPVFNTWNEGGVNGGTSGALVQLYTPPADGLDEIFSWADTTGTLHAATFSHTTPDLWFGSSVPAFTGTYTPELCRRVAGRTVCTPNGSPQNLVPSNAHITGVSRLPNQVDLFFVDAEGNARNVYSANGGTTWANVVVDGDGEGVPGSPIAAVSRTPSTIDVFYLGKAGLEQATWTGQAWTSGIVANTESVVPAGGYVTAVAQTVDDLDAFWIDPTGALERASANLPNLQPIPLVAPVTGGGKGQPGGTIASVSRKLGSVDVVFQPPSASGIIPVWYSLTANGVSASGSLPGGDATEGISIVAPSSSELRVFMKSFVSDVFTSNIVFAGVPAWSPITDIETLGTVIIPGPRVHIP